jgi:glutamate racemase
VLATAATLHSPRYLALKERYLADRPIYEDPCLGLVPLIEQESSGSQVVAAKLHTILDPMLEDGLDTLVYPLPDDQGRHPGGLWTGRYYH